MLEKSRGRLHGFDRRREFILSAENHLEGSGRALQGERGAIEGLHAPHSISPLLTGKTI